MKKVAAGCYSTTDMCGREVYVEQVQTAYGDIVWQVTRYGQEVEHYFATKKEAMASLGLGPKPPKAKKAGCGLVD